jgi:TrkA domain protein
MSDVSEQTLPGIGRSYALTTCDGSRVTVVIHHSGRRDLYAETADPSRDSLSVELNDDEARRLGAVLSGAYFKPAVVQEIEAVIGGLLIEWVTLRDNSPGAGKSIAELEIRRQTKLTVVAIQRGDGEAIIAPDPNETLRPGDRLVVVGRQEDLPGFMRHVIG